MHNTSATLAVAVVAGPVSVAAVCTYIYFYASHHQRSLAYRLGSRARKRLASKLRGKNDAAGFLQAKGISLRCQFTVHTRSTKVILDAISTRLTLLAAHQLSLPHLRPITTSMRPLKCSIFAPFTYQRLSDNPKSSIIWAIYHLGNRRRHHHRLLRPSHASGRLHHHCHTRCSSASRWMSCQSRFPP